MAQVQELRVKVVSSTQYTVHSTQYAANGEPVACLFAAFIFIILPSAFRLHFSSFVWR